MPKKTKTGLRPPPPRPGPVPASAPDPVAQWVETQKKETAAPQKKEETAAPRAPPPVAEKKKKTAPPPPIPDWESIREMLHSVGITWGTVLAARWKRSWKRTGSDSDPTEGAFLMIEFCDDSYEEFDILVGGPDDPLPETPPPPQPLGLSPIHTIRSEWTPPPEALGFSPIVTALSEEPSPESTTAPQTPTPETTTTTTPTPTTPAGKTSVTQPANNPKKRKGKAASTQPYALKKRLDDMEARKIASSSAPSSHTPTASASACAPTSHPRPTPKTKTAPPRPRKTKSPARPSTRDATTPRPGIVIHGIALRKDLGKVRRWLEDDNKDMGKAIGIRWLRSKMTLQEESKKTSSVVVYLEEDKEMDRVRLGGRWLRACRYEWDR